jgi:hypothetical protein
MSFATVMMPLFVEVFLTFALLFWAGALRSGNLRAGIVKPEEIGLRALNWPQRTAQVSNGYSNQTELPPLFYWRALPRLLERQQEGNAKAESRAWSVRYT